MVEWFLPPTARNMHTCAPVWPCLPFGHQPPD
nr:MAG TPA: hypothetical protein [Caudoviricetes sp.]